MIIERKNPMEKKHDYEVAIIGAGPAGISAGIYLERAGISPIIFEGEAPGGMLNKILKIENYPGYTDDSGPTLAFRMYSQIEELNIELINESVLKIEKLDDIYQIYTNDKVFNVKYLILATGKIPRKLDVSNANKYEGKGISYCAVCDGNLYKNKDVLVVGGGNSAFLAANYLSEIANKVYIVNRSSKLRADEKEIDSVIKKDNVEIIYNSKITNIIGKDYVEKVILNDEREIPLSAIFVCIGQEVNSAYYQAINLESDNKGIIVDKNMETSCKNVYAAGDIVSKDLYQVVTATSEGAKAAFEIIKKHRNEAK